MHGNARAVDCGYQCWGRARVFRAGGYVGFVVNLWKCVKQSLQPVLTEPKKKKEQYTVNKKGNKIE